MSLYQRNYN